MEQLLATITPILEILKDFSPMATIALALVIILIQQRQSKHVKTIKENHTHDISEKLDTVIDLMKEERFDTKEIRRTLDKHLNGRTRN
jgi:hypothetical protein